MKSFANFPKKLLIVASHSMRRPLGWQTKDIRVIKASKIQFNEAFCSGNCCEFVATYNIIKINMAVQLAQASNYILTHKQT